MDTAAAFLTVAAATIAWHRSSISLYLRTATEDWDTISIPEPQPEPQIQSTHYLTAAQGLTNHLTSAARVALWRRARKYITRAIKLRRRFWLAGDRLKSQRLQDLYKGIERVRGVVSRVRDANTGVRITRNL
jgi:hypothetical protein